MSSKDTFTDIEKKFCMKITDKLIKCPLSKPFLVPVDTNEVPNYLSIISEPMDLGTLKKRLAENKYKNSAEWASDLMKIWSNAEKFNLDGNPINEIAKRLRKKSIKKLEVIPKTEMDLWYLKLKKASNKVTQFLKHNPPNVSVSSKQHKSSKHV